MSQKISKYEPLPTQRAFMQDMRHQEILLSGSWGSGKTRAGCEKAYLHAMLYPGTLVGICRKTFTALRQTTLRTLLQEVIPPDHIVSYNKTEHVIKLINGSEIYCFGLDDPLKIQSLNLGACFVDEAIELTLDDWLLLGGRIRYNKSKVHQLFAATNPGPATHWLHQRFYVEKPLLKSGKPVCSVIESNTLENPYLPADYVEKIQSLKGRYYERFVLGKWVSYDGLVYPNFDPQKHIIDKMPEGWESWPKVVSIDFGYTNAFVCLFFAISPDDQWYLYREMYMTHRTVEEHARTIKPLIDSERPVAIYADHDAEDRATLERLGIHTKPADKSVSPGIQTIYNYLEPRENGSTGLYVLRNSLLERDRTLSDTKRPCCLIEEIQGYQYAEPRPNAVTNVKDEPVKKDDHACDALRYALYSHRTAPKPARIRRMI